MLFLLRRVKKTLSIELSKNFILTDESENSMIIICTRLSNDRKDQRKRSEKVYDEVKLTLKKRSILSELESAQFFRFEHFDSFLRKPLLASDKKSLIQEDIKTTLLSAQVSSPYIVLPVAVDIRQQNNS